MSAGNSLSCTLVSWRQSASGWLAFSQSTTSGSRRRTELIFQVAIFIVCPNSNAEASLNRCNVTLECQMLIYRHGESNCWIFPYPSRGRTGETDLVGSRVLPGSSQLPCGQCP